MKRQLTTWRNIFIISALMAFTQSSIAQNLQIFGSSTQNDINRIMRRVPYKDLISYLGYAKDSAAVEVKNGKNFYYIYLWVPVTTKDLGVRMVSPTTKVKVRNPIIGEGYIANFSSKDYFDPYITLEKSDITTIDGIANAANVSWVVIDKNDDNEEMPGQPTGDRTNALLRYKSNLEEFKKAEAEKAKKAADLAKSKIATDSISSDSIVSVVKDNIEKTEEKEPIKKMEPLPKGLYRIGFTDDKKGKLQGTFLVQVGSSSKLFSVGMSNTIEGLLKELK